MNVVHLCGVCLFRDGFLNVISSPSNVFWKFLKCSFFSIIENWPPKNIRWKDFGALSGTTLYLLLNFSMYLGHVLMSRRKTPVLLRRYCKIRSFSSCWVSHILREWVSQIWASFKVISRQTSKGDIPKTFVTNETNLRGKLKVISNLIKYYLRRHLRF